MRREGGEKGEMGRGWKVLSCPLHEFSPANLFIFPGKENIVKVGRTNKKPEFYSRDISWAVQQCSLYPSNFACCYCNQQPAQCAACISVV